MTTVSDSWRQSLATLKSKFEEQACEVKESIKDEESFAEGLKALCTLHKKETSRIQLTSSLVHSKKAILAFAKAAAVPVSDLPPDKLQNFVWGVSLAAIKVRIHELQRPSR